MTRTLIIGYDFAFDMHLLVNNLKLACSYLNVRFPPAICVFDVDLELTLPSGPAKSVDIYWTLRGIFHSEN